MAENEPKRTAARDISDLKKKLGLKTGVLPAVAPPSDGAIPAPPIGPPGGPAMQARHVTTPPGVADGGIVPPPIVAPPIAAPQARAQVYVPPPPGFQPPQPPPPDLRRDPYAMAAPAAPAYVAPEIVVVEKGEAIEGLGKKGRLSKIITVVVVALLTFVVGYSLGRIWGARHEHNFAIEAASKILEKVDALATERQKVVDAFETSKGRISAFAQKNHFVAPDMQLISDLQAIDFQPGNAHDIYQPNYQFLENKVDQEIVDYYSTNEKLASLLQRHITLSQQDASEYDDYDKAQAEQVAQQQAGGTSGLFGLVFDTTKPISVGDLVEVGAPGCKVPAQGANCPPTDLTYQVRTAMGAPWDTKAVDPKAKDADRMVIIDSSKALFQSIVHGGPALTAVRGYAERQKEIMDTLNVIQQIQTDLDKKLKEAAGQPKVFVF